MIRLLLSSILLAGCGGSGDAVVNLATSGTANTILPISPAGLHILKPATVHDGYEGGLRVTRDTTGMAGGLPSHVNAASIILSKTGADNTALEWASVSLLENYADKGENVAFYAQANKHGTGPTWAAVSEVSDTTGKAGASVAHEFDVWTTGADNGLRIGLEIVSGDARHIRGLGKSAQADATTAVRIGQTTASPWATWKTGLELTGNFRESAIKLVDPSGRVVFEVKPNGDIYRRGVVLP